jgi:hypothetical protein
MHIRHGRDVMMNKGQAGNVAQLLLRLFINVISPDFHRDFTSREGLLDRHGGLT